MLPKTKKSTFVDFLVKSLPRKEYTALKSKAREFAVLVGKSLKPFLVMAFMLVGVSRFCRVVPQILEGKKCIVYIGQLPTFASASHESY